jgi:hypothetical protein
VTAFVAGTKGINFYLEGVELPIKLVSPGTIKGHNLHIKIPDAAQQPTPGTWAGLQSISTSLSGKIGKHAIVSSVGCKSKKHKFGAKLTFAPNPTPPPKSTASGTSTASCK